MLDYFNEAVSRGLIDPNNPYYQEAVKRGLITPLKRTEMPLASVPNAYREKYIPKQGTGYGVSPEKIDKDLPDVFGAINEALYTPTKIANRIVLGKEFANLSDEDKLKAFEAHPLVSKLGLSPELTRIIWDVSIDPLNIAGGAGAIKNVSKGVLAMAKTKGIPVASLIGKTAKETLPELKWMKDRPGMARVPIPEGIPDYSKMTFKQLKDAKFRATQDIGISQKAGYTEAIKRDEGIISQIDAELAKRGKSPSGMKQPAELPTPQSTIPKVNTSVRGEQLPVSTPLVKNVAPEATKPTSLVEPITAKPPQIEPPKPPAKPPTAVSGGAEELPKGNGDLLFKTIKSVEDEYDELIKPKPLSDIELNKQMKSALKDKPELSQAEELNRLYMEKPQRALKEAEALKKPVKFKGFNPQRVKNERAVNDRIARLKAQTEGKLTSEDEAIARVIEKRIINKTKKPYVPYTEPLFEEPKDGLIHSVKTMYEKVLASVKTAIRNETPTGTKLMDTFDDVTRKSAQRESQWLYQSKGSKKLSLNEQYNVSDILEGYSTGTNDKTKAMAQTIKSQLDTIGNEAQGKGIMVRTGDGGLVSFSPKDDYFPHWIPLNQMLSGEQWAIQEAVNTAVSRGWAQTTTEGRELVNHFLDYLRSNGGKDKFLYDMVKKGQASGTAEARHIMETFISPKRARRFGSLEYAREANLPFYVRRLDKALPRFYEGVARRLEEISAFGQDSKKLMRWVDDIGAEGGDVARADRIITELIGKHSQDRALSKAVSYFTDFQVMAKMGLSPLTNATQVNNSLARTNFTSMIKAFKSAITKEGREFAYESGAVLEAIQRDLMAEIGSSTSTAGKFLKYSGFNAVEAWNRIVSANAGKFYAEELFGKLLKDPSNKFARRRLKDIIPNINIDEAVKRGSLTKQQLYDAGFKCSQDTQFLYRAQDLPEAWRSGEIVRLMTQFKSFGIQQKDFIKGYIWGELIKGNPKPLIYLAVGAGLTGEAVIDIKNVILGKNRKDMSLVMRVLDNILLAGGVGILTDAIQTAAYGKSSWASWIAGPTATDLGELAWASYEAIKGNSKQLGKKAIKTAPGIAGKIYPPLAIPARIGTEIGKQFNTRGKISMPQAKPSTDDMYIQEALKRGLIDKNNPYLQEYLKRKQAQ